MFENSMWLLIVAGGPLLLAIVIAWALMTRRPKGPVERRERDRATGEFGGNPATLPVKCP